MPNATEVFPVKNLLPVANKEWVAKGFWCEGQVRKVVVAESDLVGHFQRRRTERDNIVYSLCSETKVRSGDLRGQNENPQIFRISQSNQSELQISHKVKVR